MMSYNVRVCGYVKESISEGIGLRTVIFFSGCPFRCQGCHNPESQSYEYGKLFTKERQDKIINDIKRNNILKGVTFCGGEPFDSRNYKEVLKFVHRLKKETSIDDFWSYSGYSFEELVKKPQAELLREIDVLIDGRFIESKKDLTLEFRGSSNQRIIDVQQTLKKKKVVLWGGVVEEVDGEFNDGLEDTLQLLD